MTNPYHPISEATAQPLFECGGHVEKFTAHLSLEYTEFRDGNPAVVALWRADHEEMKASYGDDFINNPKTLISLSKRIVDRSTDRTLEAFTIRFKPNAFEIGATQHETQEVVKIRGTLVHRPPTLAPNSPFTPGNRSHFLPPPSYFRLD